MKNCPHNQRCRYTHGFHCEDCDTFFSKDSPTYRSDELLSTLWMVLNNINVKRRWAKLEIDKDVERLKEKIGIGVKHKNYEELITEAEKLMAKHGVNSDSATVTLKRSGKDSISDLLH